ncbi:putative protein-signal peptide prediction [Cyclobacterium qasimii M12-11B]|uniref:Exo-alpha-sialidase n=1 Tax=Cyclobacterium qasimii M12-11B TaxID=641524 RepID=S7WR42_9BACT|nr:putative protein-signal peptide prediction [Cyclobacterium qasimii M12-11B]
MTPGFSNESLKDSLEVEKIWDKAPHNAFPDMIRFKGDFYIALREGNNHMPDKSGAIRILKSKDGEDWQSVALLEEEDRDVREARLSITPEGRIMVLTAVGVYDDGYKILYPMVSFSDTKGEGFSSLEKASIDMEPSLDWIWSLTWHNNIGYGIVYRNYNAAREVHLLKTTDGINFNHVAQLPIDGGPNESTIRFDENGKMYVLVRREDGDKMGVLAKSEAPYTDWTTKKLTKRLGGPNFLFLDKNTLVMGTRDYRKTGAKTVIYLTDLEGNINKTMEVPSGGDTSYPGMVIYKKKLWFVYYSSHEEKTSIYLTKIPIKDLYK